MEHIPGTQPRQAQGPVIHGHRSTPRFLVNLHCSDPGQHVNLLFMKILYIKTKRRKITAKQALLALSDKCKVGSY
jgi:hypothetical protein